MSANSFAAFKRAEARERLAALRRARKSRRAALTEQRTASMFGDAAKWRITNLRQVFKAMSEYVKAPGKQAAAKLLKQTPAGRCSPRQAAAIVNHALRRERDETGRH